MDNARVNTITDLLRRCALMSIFLLTLSGCQVPLSDWPQPTLAVAGPPESFPCSIFDESQWQEFRFGLDSPADVVAIVARSRVKNKERIWTDSLKHGLETVDWHEFGDELNVHYRAWFRKEQGLFRVMGYWAPNPTMEQVLDCLGFPDYYKAIYAANIEAIQLSLTLWYTERGIIVEHVSFYYQEQLPTIDADYGIDRFFFVAPGEHEKMVVKAYMLGDDLDILAYESCILRPWPGSIEALEVESFLDEYPLCIYL